MSFSKSVDNLLGEIQSVQVGSRNLRDLPSRRCRLYSAGDLQSNPTDPTDLTDNSTADLTNDPIDLTDNLINPVDLTDCPYLLLDSDTPTESQTSPITPVQPPFNPLNPVRPVSANMATAVIHRQPRFCGTVGNEHLDKIKLEEYTVDQWLSDAESLIASKGITADKDKIQEALLLDNNEHGDAHAMITTGLLSRVNTFQQFESVETKESNGCIL